MQLSSRPPKVVEDLNTLIAESITIQEALHTDWTSWREYVDGEQDSELRLEKWQEQDYFPANICKSYVQTVLPILLSAQPTPFVVAEDRRQDEYAVEITKILHALRDRLRFNWTLHHIYDDALSIGTGVGKVWWDINAAQGQGDAAFSWLDPFTVYPDPAARFIEDCEYVAICNKYTEPRIRRLFPKARFRKSELGAAGTRPSAAYGEGIQGRPGVVALGGPEKAGESKYSLWEVYHKFGEKLTIYSGTKVFYDGDNPTPGNNFPVFLFPISPVGDSLWGTPAIKDIMGIQDAINLTNMRIAENARLMGNAIWLTNDPSFKATNEPGGIARYKGDVPPARISPPPLPDYIFAWLQMLYNLADTVSGVYDVTRGQRPKGVQSGVAIQQLQSSAISRISLPVEDFGQILEGVWQAILEVISRNYTGERTIGYSRDNVAEAITVSPELFGGRSLSTGFKRVPYKYRCIVQPSGDLPISQVARVEQAMRLVGVIPASMLVDQLKWPDSEKLVEKLEQQEAQAQQMQAAQMELQTVSALAQIKMIEAQVAQMEAQTQAEQGQQIPPVDEVFNPEEQQVLATIAGKVQAGEPLSQEEQMYLDALPPEDREVADAHIGGAQ